MSEELKAIEKLVSDIQGFDRETRYLPVVEALDRARLILSEALTHLTPDKPDAPERLKEIGDRHTEDELFYRRTNSSPPRKNAWATTHADRATLLSALTAAEARAEAAEARVGYLQIIIDCVVANCEASASSYQERIETIHRVTSALALEWAEGSALKGAPDDR